MEGRALFEVLIASTGLPPEAVTREMNRILGERGLSADTLTLDDLREVLAVYLQETLVEAKSAVAKN